MFSLALPSLLSLFLLISRALSTYVTMPLYIDPSNNSWQTLYNAIASNPSVTFNLIINPASGPGSTPYPDEETIAGLSHLNAYPNVNTLGYVHVDWCSRSQSDVQSEVSKYASWSSYPSADIHVSGIFFDEAPADYSDSSHAYMSTVAGYVKSAFPAGKNHVSFNPGAITASQYFDIADSICVFEDHYSTYSANTPASIPADQKTASTIIIYGFDGSQDQQNAVVEAIARDGIAGVYITTSSGYTDFSSLWPQFVDSMAANGGAAPAPASPAPVPSSTSSAAPVTPSSTAASAPPPATPQPQPSDATPSSQPEQPAPSDNPAPAPSASAPAQSPPPSDGSYDGSETEELSAPEPTPSTSSPDSSTSVSPTSTSTSTGRPHHRPHRANHKHWTRPQRHSH